MAHVHHLRQTTLRNGDRVETIREEVGRDEAASLAVAERESRAERIIWFASGILLILLAFRFVLSLLGANRGNAFADFIYNVSHPFVAPFFNLFNYNVVDYGAARLEFYTLFAMAVYAVVAWILAELVTLGRREAH